MANTNTVDRERLNLAVEQLVRANRESQRPFAHAQEIIGTQLSALDSVRFRYRASIQTTRTYFNRIAAILERSISAEDANRRLLAQLDEAHSGDMEPEERKFLEHSMEYYRRRLLKDK